VLSFNQQIESHVRELPDASAARSFIERLETEHPRVVRILSLDPGLLSDSLALAAWSPLLTTTLSQHPEYISWLARERLQTRVRSRDELNESLARFALTSSQSETQVLLARFRRRELLRIYLHDIRNTSTLVEITEELSNLADSILEHALGVARQELDNRYGSPQYEDAKGRTATASFCVVAMGKLGSHELNYASDIDLLFLYSEEGTTSATGTRDEITNREYFNKLAANVSRLVGEQSGEGAAYRVDLRLRPYGRDGALAVSLAEAVRYYRDTAQAWELQALIRSRAAAGDSPLYSRFADRVRHRVYAREQTVERALANVRLAKQKIDRHHAQDAGGFNVKLGRGGIREIEFIAQALQLAFGGRDEWLRAAHTLISLGRLADRRLITERERTQLSDAYLFLRKLEHRLQMEHGLQTHSIPEDDSRRSLLARRMDFAGADALLRFDRELIRHTTHVRSAYDRVFGEAAENQRSDHERNGAEELHGVSVSGPEPAIAAEQQATTAAATIFAAHLIDSTENVPENAMGQTLEPTVKIVAEVLSTAASSSLNSRRALMLACRIASSLDKSSGELCFSTNHLRSLVRLCGASEVFGDMIASNPALILALPVTGVEASPDDYRAILRNAVEGGSTLREEMAGLRREWAKIILQIGALDAANTISLSEANKRQSILAAASLDAGCLIAAREMERRYGMAAGSARLAVLGLGRLGGEGMDYGSDLDVILVYDDSQASPVSQLSPLETYARFAELLVAALSSVTRDGYLYRVDLRLRPDGKNGVTCSGARAFSDYLEHRAVEWEWLAYVKLRAAAGDLELGTIVEREARRIIHAAAQKSDKTNLRLETRRVRERLELERTRRPGQTTDIKYGPGGMLDVYFASRYLQLRDNVPDLIEDRSTRAVLARLRETGSLGEENYLAMRDGYALLRLVDHNLRLIVGRSTRLPAADHAALRDIAHKLKYASATELSDSLAIHMRAVREAYDNITNSDSQDSELRSQNG
jgi:glutamate-ammonia-ligase adenylyltransferase